MFSFSTGVLRKILEQRRHTGNCSCRGISQAEQGSGAHAEHQGGSIRLPLCILCLLLLAGSDAALAQQTGVPFASSRCQIAFAYAADWEVVPDATDPLDPCRFLVRPRDWQQRLAAHDSVDLYTILVQIIPQGVWDHAPMSGFQRRGPAWVVLGRHDLEQSADSISGPGWNGLRGIAPQACYRVEGDYAGLCDQPTALVGTPRRSVMLIGGPRSEDEFDRILASLRFQ